MSIISPEKTGASPQIDRRTALIASLRSLANLFEDIPELPLMNRIEWNLGGCDSEALRVMEELKIALAAEGVTHSIDSGNVSVMVTIPLAGVTATIYHVYDAAVDAHFARSSYHDVVQVDTDQATAVSA